MEKLIGVNSIKYIEPFDKKVSNRYFYRPEITKKFLWWKKTYASGIYNYDFHGDLIYVSTKDDFLNDHDYNEKYQIIDDIVYIKPSLELTHIANDTTNIYMDTFEEIQKLFDDIHRDYSSILLYSDK